MDSGLKRGLMLQYPCARGRDYVCKNIGDYVQAVATRQFVPNIDEYIEQEEANLYFPTDNQKVRLIMNGWFQWRSENWPPSKFIKPLLVSMHISPLKADDLLKPEGIEFLKDNGPVGCRDLYTKSLLESKGIPAYFSACMTLTLGYKYSIGEKERNGVYFVDPYFEIKPLFTKNKKNKQHICLKQFFKFIKTYLLNIRTINKLASSDFFDKYSPKGFLDRDKYLFKKKYKATMFYSIYSKKFSKKLIKNANFITHWMDVDMKKDTNDDLLNIAENLIEKYASASMVITSRIHAGLPSLGLGTPVIFVSNEEVTSDKGSFNTPGRLDGLIQLFHTINIKNNKFEKTNDLLLDNKISINSKIENKDDWKVYCERLKEQCMEFMK